MGKKKILVIDDEPEVGELVSELVKSSFPFIDVKIVYNGFSAGRILSDYFPDMIILDIMLPGVNGFDVCQQIRTSGFLKGTKILASDRQWPPTVGRTGAETGHGHDGGNTGDGVGGSWS